MTPYIWKIDGNFWSHKRFPMVMIKVFGYTHKRTVLQFVTFWIWVVVSFAYHYFKWTQSEKILANRRAGKDVEGGSAESFDDDSA
jgi:hypothetical protein